MSPATDPIEPDRSGDCSRLPWHPGRTLSAEIDPPRPRQMPDICKRTALSAPACRLSPPNDRDALELNGAGLADECNGADIAGAGSNGHIMSTVVSEIHPRWPLNEAFRPRRGIANDDRTSDNQFTPHHYFICIDRSRHHDPEAAYREKIGNTDYVGNNPLAHHPTYALMAAATTIPAASKMLPDAR